LALALALVLALASVSVSQLQLMSELVLTFQDLLHLGSKLE